MSWLVRVEPSRSRTKAGKKARRAHQELLLLLLLPYADGYSDEIKQLPPAYQTSFFLFFEKLIDDSDIVVFSVNFTPDLNLDISPIFDALLYNNTKSPLTTTIPSPPRLIPSQAKGKKSNEAVFPAYCILRTTFTVCASLRVIIQISGITDGTRLVN